MAIIGVPALSIYLVEHVGGGAILHAGGGYVANTLVSASVVSAFQTAATTLAGLASGAGSVAAAPITATAAAIAVVGVGSYCYLYGIPAPIEAVLAKAGFKASASMVAPKAAGGAFVVSVSSLAPALVMLGLAGYICYSFYKTREDALRAVAEDPQVDPEDVAVQSFGARLWEQYGEPISAGLGDASESIANFIRDAVEKAGVEHAAVNSLAWLRSWSDWVKVNWSTLARR